MKIILLLLTAIVAKAQYVAVINNSIQSISYNYSDASGHYVDAEAYGAAAFRTVLSGGFTIGTESRGHSWTTQVWLYFDGDGVQTNHNWLNHQPADPLAPGNLNGGIGYAVGPDSNILLTVNSDLTYTIETGKTDAEFQALFAPEKNKVLSALLWLTMVAGFFMGLKFVSPIE